MPTKLLIPCADCGGAVVAVRMPAWGYEFVHGSCVDDAHTIVERLIA